MKFFILSVNIPIYNTQSVVNLVLVLVIQYRKGQAKKNTCPESYWNIKSNECQPREFPKWYPEHWKATEASNLQI